MFLTAITFVLVLGALVLIHEWGHFTAAKLMRIRVEEFGFGLPPRAIGKKIGETIYSLNWLPIGGFVRLYGEDENHPEAIKKERSRAFFAKAPWQRAIVLVAGVVMNFFLGWMIVSFLLTQGVMVPGEDVYVDKISENSPASTAGMRSDDVIRQVVSSDGTLYDVTKPRDLINAVNDHLGETITLKLKREEKEIDVLITPRLKEDIPEGEGALGITISNYIEEKYPWYQAPFVGFTHSIETLGLLVSGFGTTIWRVITLQSVQADIAGPVGIGKLVGEAREFGILAVLDLTSILSFNLAILNILPFPALDGGRLVFVVIEGITGKRVKPTWEQNAHQIGMALLLLLLLLITINDVVKLVQG